MRYSKIFIERIGITIVLLFFAALQYNAISKGNYAGQDFRRHCNIIVTSAQDPWKALTTHCGVRTPSTLYHFIGGLIYRLVGKSRAWSAIAVINCISNMAALFLFYLLIRRVITSLILRFSCFLFVAFLPLTVITSVVIATEAFMPLVFISVIWLIILIVERLKQRKSCVGWMIAGGALLVIAFAIKFIYGLCFVAVVLLGIILGFCRVLDWKQLRSGILILIIIPLGICGLMYFAFIHYQAILLDAWEPATSWAPYKGDWEPTKYWIKHDLPFENKILVEKRMDFQSIFFLKSTDRQLLQAPYFHQAAFQGDKIFRPFFQSNYYSYPAMMHLAIFTDFLNMYQPIRLSGNALSVTDEFYTRIRSQENQDRMRLAVCTGLLFSLALMVALCGMVLRTAYLIWKKELKSDDVPILTLLILTLTLFFGVALGLPFTHFTYQTGVWLPRHIMPVIISMWILLFVVLEREVVHRVRWARWIVFLMVILQSALHVSFLWVAF